MENLCEESILKDFFDGLQDSSNKNIRILNIGRTSNQNRSSINFTVIDNSLDCSSCDLNVLNNLAQQFNLQNIITIFSQSNVITSVTSSRLVVTSSCKEACDKKEGEQKKISFNSHAGQINRLKLPDSSTGVSLLNQHNQNTCLIGNSKRPLHILFFPPKKTHPVHAQQSNRVELVMEGEACPLVLNIHNSHYKTQQPCHHINIHFKPIQQFPCLLESVEAMVTLFAQFFHLQTSQIFIHDFGSNNTNNDLYLIFSFTTDVIGCTHCAKNILKSFIARLVDSQGKVTNDFGKVLSNKFSISDINYSVTSQAKHSIVVSEKHVPIWVYMIPALILLLILLLLLFACCFCCAGSRKRLSKFINSSCYCCYGNRKHENRRKSISSIHRVNSTMSKDVESNLVVTNTTDKKGDDINNSNNTAKTVSYATVHKSHNLLAPSFSHSGDVKTLNTSQQQKAAATTTTTTTTTTATKTPVEGKTVSFRSNHRRSYSDGYLLDDEYLDLPSPPAARKSNDVTRKTSHRASFRYRGNNGDTSSSHKLTIPIRITARVKNISRSLENGLDGGSSANYITFDEAPDVSKYRSKETVYERKSPLDSTSIDVCGNGGGTSYRRKSLEKHTTAKRYPWESHVKTFRRKSTKKWFESPRYASNWKSFSESEF